MHATLRTSLLLCLVAAAPLLGQTTDSSPSRGFDISNLLMRTGGEPPNAYAAGVGLYRPLDSGRVRYLGVAGGSSLDLKFYGTNPNGFIASNPLEYNFNMVGFLQRLQVRLAKSSAYAGLQYTYANTRSDFAPFIAPRGVPTDLNINIGGLGANFDYDTRDNFIDPRTGASLAANVTGYSNALGGSSDFGKAGAVALYYAQPWDRWSIGGRLDAQSAWGDVPFFYLPYLQMRGLKSQQYTGNAIALAEGELRYSLAPRWTLLGFGGVGGTSHDWNDVGRVRTVGAGGVGFRYLLARRIGLRSGLDMAVGPDGDISFYVQNGSAWR
jgi:hypothetical protein